MTSQLNVDTIVDKAGSGGSNIKIANTSVAVSEGGTATTTTLQGLAKAWGHIATADSTTFDDSFMFGTVTDNGTGDYTFTFSNDLANTNYCVVSGVYNGTSHGDFQDVDAMVNSTGNVRIYNGYVSATNSAMTAHDVLGAQIVIFGDG